MSTTLHYPPPAKIPPQVQATMKMNDNIAYAALPRELKGRRNMVVGTQKNGGRFRSGKSRTDDVCDMFC
jgi:PAB-dependent poly(A)-specific ribonuclease subunit 2